MDPGSPPPHRAAFSLIELLIAMTLSIMIIMIAYKTFAMVLDSVNTMNRMRSENALLRSGYMLVCEDVDFWNSHANPEFPYLKGYMSDQVLDGIDGSNTPDDKRIFRPVSFPKDLDDPRNPNWAQPNDRRSWYRNYANQNPHNFCRPSGGEFNWYGHKNYMPQTLFNSDSALLADSGTIGLGWEFWHMHGDYSIVSNLAMDPVENPAASAEELVKGAKPTLQWQVFKDLGQTGVLHYLPPGTMNLILRPSTNLTVDAIGDQNRNYDKGEIPWSLTTPDWILDSKGNKARPKPGSVLTPTTAQFPDNQRSHYAENMLAYPFDQHNFIGKTDYTNNSYNFPPYPFAADINICVSESRPRGDYKGTLPIALFYGNRPVQQDFAGTLFDFDQQVNTRVRRPILRLADGTDDLEFWNRRKDYLSVTWQVPRNHTDSPIADLTAKPPDMPAMATGIMRYMIGGNDKALCTVRVVDPDTGTNIELRFHAPSTTLRGARQHWAWRSRWADPGNRIKDMGDNFQ